MALRYRKRIRVNDTTTVNVSKSGASVSKRVGLFTINSRGHVTLRLGNGFSWRIF